MVISPIVEEAARRRINESQTERNRVWKAIKSGRPLDAEDSTLRKLRRFQSASGVNTEQAKKLAEYEPSVLKSLSGERRLGAERIQGRSTDFVGVSFIELAKAASGTVGRVIHNNGNPIGSGFMISDSLFLTNNHVILDKSKSKNLQIEFNYEMDYNENPKPVSRFSLDADTFFLSSPESELDFTIIAIGKKINGQRDLSDFGYCPLLDSDDKHVLSEFVNIIQHPGGDYKQIVIRENRIVTRLENFLHYVADTEEGSSGSPVFNDQWEVIALHHWGGPSMESGPDGSELNKDINEGIRISRIVSKLKSSGEILGEQQRLLINSALKISFRHPSILKENLNANMETSTLSQLPEDITGSESKLVPETKSNGEVSWEIPLTVSLKLGNIKPPAIDLQPATQKILKHDSTASSQSEAITIDRDYQNRNGYNPNFLLGSSIPFPKLHSSQIEHAARKKEIAEGEDPYELKYQHFSIVMNSLRRMAFFTAVNIDGSTSIHVDRDTGEPESFAEASEKWYNDPRIDSDAQSDQTLYSNQRPRLFDRGHLVRREDPNWGTPTRAKRANADTFHFTNCSTQESKFNQSAQLWQGIEKYILDNARAEREKISVFTGPVFEEDDPIYRYTRVPKQFWKILARLEGGQLLATGLIADQSDRIQRLPERMGGESFDDTSKVVEFQTTISAIERLTGLDFGLLRNHDTFQQGPESLEGDRILVTQFRDLKLTNKNPTLG